MTAQDLLEEVPAELLWSLKEEAEKEPAEEPSPMFARVIARELGAVQEPIVGRTRTTTEEVDWQLPVFVLPLQPCEFVCSSCHLIKLKSQLDDDSGTCCDCVATAPSRHS